MKPISRGGSITSGTPVKQASSDEDDGNIVKSKKVKTGQETVSEIYNPRKKRDSFESKS